MHQRQVCKEEEEAIKVDLHEGKMIAQTSQLFSGKVIKSSPSRLRKNQTVLDPGAGGLEYSESDGRVPGEIQE